MRKVVLLLAMILISSCMKLSIAPEGPPLPRGVTEEMIQSTAEPDEVREFYREMKLIQDDVEMSQNETPAD